MDKAPNLLRRPLTIASPAESNVRSYLRLTSGAWLIAATIYAVWGVPVIRGLNANHAIMGSGTPATVATSTTTRSERWFSKTKAYDYAIDVTYQDAAGVEHKGSRYSPEAPHGKLEVRYDAKRPALFALNWVEQSSGRRWFDVYFHAFLLAIVPASVTWGALKDARRLSHARFCANDGVETVLEVVEATAAPLKGEPTRTRYKVSYVDPSGVAREARFTRSSHELHFVGEKKLLGVVSPRRPRKPVLVDVTLAPYERALPAFNWPRGR